MNFGASGGIGHVAQQMIPIYGLVNTYKKAKALKKAGKIKGEAAAHVAGQIGANILSNAPTATVEFKENPPTLLTPFGTVSTRVKPNTLGIAASAAGTAGGIARSAIVGSRFQDLIDEKTDAYMRKHPSANRESIRKKIKSRLYHEGEVDIDKIKDD